MASAASQNLSNDTRNAIIDNYNCYALGIDNKDWAMVRNCFADEVMLDYGDLSAPGGDIDSPQSADNWVAILQGAINGFDMTQHIISNHRFEMRGSEVVCCAYLSADHIFLAADDTAINDDTAISDDCVVRVVGEYTNVYRVVGQVAKIVRSALKVKYSTGNTNLFSLAQERAAAQEHAG